MGAHSAPTTPHARRFAVAGLLAGGAAIFGAGAASAQPVDVPTGSVEGLPDSVTVDVPDNVSVPAEVNQYADVAGFDPSGLVDAISSQLGSAIPGQNTHGAAALAAAQTKIGSPYVWGATGPDAFDCSGLTSWAYKQAGVDIPRTSQEQAAQGTPVDINNLQPGDLVTFYSGATHVGIYAGNGQVLNAPTEGVPVGYAPLDSMPIYNAVRF